MVEDLVRPLCATIFKKYILHIDYPVFIFLKHFHIPILQHFCLDMQWMLIAKAEKEHPTEKICLNNSILKFMLLWTECRVPTDLCVRA